MKKILRLTRLMVCLCAVLTSTTAAARWVGAGVINVNGSWYHADEHSSTSGNWAPTGFDGHDFGFISPTTTTLTIGGQVQIWMDGSATMANNSTTKMFYKIDDADSYSELTLNYYKYEFNNNFFQSGGNPNNQSDFSTATISISELACGEHYLHVCFEDANAVGEPSSTVYTAEFTKGYDISTATVTGINASYDWTGSAINPVPVVTLNENELISTTDYDVSYSEGCSDVGIYNVNITGKGEYVGTIERSFNINDVYYLVGTMSNNQINENYRLIKNTAADVDEYTIENVALSNGCTFKVVSPGRKNQWGGWTWYPDGMDNDYTINYDGIYNIYFRPAGNGGDDWYYHTFYVAYQDYKLTVDVTLAPTGYGTYYHGKCDVILPSGTVAYILTGVNNDKPTYKMIADGDDNGNNTIPAGTAVLLYNSQTPEYVTLTLTTLSATNSDTNLLKGSDVQTTTTGGAKYYKLTYGNDNTTFGWYYGEDEGAAFTSPAHKAWLALPATGSRAFFNLPGDEATGIATIENKQQNADNVWFDLNGRRINAPMTKGIYVKEGRKMVIK